MGPFRPPLVSCIPYGSVVQGGFTEWLYFSHGFSPVSPFGGGSESRLDLFLDPDMAFVIVGLFTLVLCVLLSHSPGFFLFPYTLITFKG